MRIIPVLDLLGGIVVRGVAGRRNEYRPIVSRLVAGSDPLEVARAFRDQCELDTLYVADLDAILHDRPAWDLYRQLQSEGFRLWIDAGLASAESARRVLEGGAEIVIAGLESSPGPETLARMCRQVEGRRVTFSLDLQSGVPMRDGTGWGACHPLEIAEAAIAAGVGGLIVLDLAQVGVNAGVSTLELCRAIQDRHPGLPLVTGGGVRDAGDLELLANAGIAEVLVASALHDGRLTRADLERWRR